MNTSQYNKVTFWNKCWKSKCNPILTLFKGLRLEDPVSYTCKFNTVSHNVKEMSSNKC